VHFSPQGIVAVTLPLFELDQVNLAIIGPVPIAGPDTGTAVIAMEHDEIKQMMGVQMNRSITIYVSSVNGCLQANSADRCLLGALRAFLSYLEWESCATLARASPKRAAPAGPANRAFLARFRLRLNGATGGG
jgi:hypothetical protein